MDDPAPLMFVNNHTASQESPLCLCLTDTHLASYWVHVVFFKSTWTPSGPAVNPNHSSCPHQSSVWLWPRHPILSPRDINQGSVRREMVWRAELSCSTLTTTTFIAGADTFTVDGDGSPRPTPLLMMMWAQRAARRHPSHHMCPELYWLSINPSHMLLYSGRG